MNYVQFDAGASQEATSFDFSGNIFVGVTAQDTLLNNAGGSTIPDSVVTSGNTIHADRAAAGLAGSGVGAARPPRLPRLRVGFRLSVRSPREGRLHLMRAFGPVLVQAAGAG